MFEMEHSMRTKAWSKPAKAKGIGAVVSAVTLLAAVLMPSGSVVAQSTPPSGSIQSGGGVKAQVDSQVLGINIFAGNFALPIKFGTSGARVDGKTASAASGALDLGLLGSLIGLALVNTPTLDKYGLTLDFLGPALGALAASTSDSRTNAGALKTRSVPEMVRGPLQFRDATETVSAPENGPSTSKTTVGRFGLDLGIVQISVEGMESSTYADPKEVKSTSHLNLLEFKIAGVPTALRNLHWDFSQKLGQAPVSSFVVESGQIGPMQYDMSKPGYMNAGIARINEMLAEVNAGITLRAPTENADKPGTLSSLRFELKNSKLLADTVGKIFLSTISDTYFDWSEDQAAKIPELGLVFTVVNIVIGALTGQGGLSLELGGVGGSIAPKPIETFNYGTPGGSTSQGTSSPTPPTTPVQPQTSSQSTVAPRRSASVTTVPVVTTPTTIPVTSTTTYTDPSGDRPLSLGSTEKVVASEKVPGLILILLAAVALTAAWVVDRRRIQTVIAKGERK